MEPFSPIAGKTYSLFGKDTGTRSYYERVSALANELTAQLSLPEQQLLGYIQSESMNAKKLRKASGPSPADPRFSYIMGRCKEMLSEYLGDVKRHLRSVSLYNRFSDRELLTTREQYLLYVIEIELVNRVHLAGFRNSRFRIALLPYCLKESHETCRAEPDEIDNRCRACLKTCLVNRAGGILKEHDIHPYILSRGRVGGILQELRARHGNIGVLGVACIVELVMGMRLCMKAGLPVVGIPLNANRCPRWMGTMHDTSVDLEAVEKLLGD